MKAVVYSAYGGPEVLRLADLEKPAPAASQVLVQVLAASINAGDYRVRTGKPMLMRLMVGGLRRPQNNRIGGDIAGLVAAVGEGVTQFRPGDEVFGVASGGLAEFVLANPNNLVPKPAGVSFATAAAVPIAALTALQGLRDAAGLQKGQQVLIQGASGGVGTFAVQLARHFGAQVTAVCSSRNQQLVREIGAGEVIDYTKEDFTRRPERYDLIFAVNGYHPLAAYRRALQPQGIYVCAGGTLPQIFQAMLLGRLYSRRGGRQMRNMGIARVKQADLQILAGLLQQGAIRPIIDREFPLPEIVAAFRYVEETHARGKVVVTVT